MQTTEEQKAQPPFPPEFYEMLKTADASSALQLAFSIINSMIHDLYARTDVMNKKIETILHVG